MSRERIKTLTDRYLDGMTTNAEEQELRELMAQAAPPAGDKVDAERQFYAALFAFEQKERDRLADQDRHVICRRQPRPASRRSPHRIDIFLASAAASAAVLFIIALTMPHRQYDYAVIDGRVYTDRATVERQAEEALMMVAGSEDDAFDALRLMQ